MRVKKCLLQNEMKVVLRQAPRKIEDTIRKKKSKNGYSWNNMNPKSSPKRGCFAL